MINRLTIRLCLCAALATATLASLTLTAQDAARSTVVHVTGRGATRYDARDDAIRQALQMAVQQLVLAQRVVQNEKLVLDKVASSMNGFVNRFTPTAESDQGGQFTLEADVEVAASRIENFVGTSAGATAQIDTNSLAASIQAERASRRARSEVAAGLLFGFPQQTLVASSPKVALDKANPDIVALSSTIQFAPAFVRRLKEGLQALGASRESAESLQSRVEGDGTPSFRVCVTADPIQPDIALLNSFSASGAPSTGTATAPPECWLLRSIDPAVFGALSRGMNGEGIFWFEALVDNSSRIPQSVADVQKMRILDVLETNLVEPDWGFRYVYAAFPLVRSCCDFSILISTKATTVTRRIPASALLKSHSAASLTIEPVLLDCRCDRGDLDETRLFVPWIVFPRDATLFPLDDRAFDRLKRRETTQQQ